MQAIQSSLSKRAVDVSFDGLMQTMLDPSEGIRVILPGGKGLDSLRNNEEFWVEGVFFHPGINALSYRGRHSSTTDAAAKDVIPISALVEVPGESEVGIYDTSTGEIHPAITPT
jgi:hypothetical protein